ncbi:MAG: hypothetical protein ACK2T4_00075 [Candidatus Promineifilaceae bacterium]|jgi:hypothetical protein
MSRQRKNNKITRMDKLTIGALSMLGLVGGWNVIGNMENSTSAKTIDVDEVPTATPPAVRPTLKPWPTIQPLGQTSRLEIKALPTLAAGMLAEGGTDNADQVGGETAVTLDLPALPNAAPMPTLAPLPTLPEYVPPPPPPPSQPSQPSSNNGGGGGNKSTGS